MIKELQSYKEDSHPLFLRNIIFEPFQTKFSLHQSTRNKPPPLAVAGVPVALLSRKYITNP